VVRVLFFILLSSFAFADLQYLAKSLGPKTSFENVSTDFFADTHTSGAEYDDAIDEDVAIGFSFPFNGNIYSTVNIDSNGHLAFVDITSEYVNQELPRDNRAQSIYPYWDDLNVADGGTITYGTIGSGESKHFIVYWKDVPRYGDSSKKYTFQVVLYQSGVIRFRYDSGTSTNGESATVGIQENDNHYDQHSYNNSDSLDETQDILYRPRVHLTPIVPNCTTPVVKVEMSTYDRSGDNSHAGDEFAFKTLLENYATDSNWMGSGYQEQINGSGNPYGNDNNYLTVFEGYIYLPDTGVYQFGVDGDDAIELYLDDKLITGWYGGHGNHNHEEYAIEVDVQAGWHKLEYHQEELSGGDNYYLYWKRPGGVMEKVPASQFFHCTAVVSKESTVLSDLVNGTTNPKRIPGATIEYKIEARNLGNIRINSATLADTLESNFEWIAESIKVTSPSINSGNEKSITDADDGDEGSFNNNKVEVNCQMLKKAEECSITFRVTIK
jgi:uncharacterized repeat protein (TIGR01451 family)